MREIELNRRMIQAFPELRERYDAETTWNGGEDTGSHVIYGDVFNPALHAYLKCGNFHASRKYFDFAESLLETKDDYAEEVAIITILESVYFDEYHDDDIVPLLGSKSQAIWNEFIKAYGPRGRNAENDEDCAQRESEQC